MSIQLPSSAGQLIALGKQMSVGLVELGQQLGITQITPVQFQAVLTAFTDADNAFNIGRTTRQAASNTYTGAVADLDAWLGVTKGVLIGCFGGRWTTAWAQAGFINNTTQIPDKIADRITLAGRLAAFFTAKPSYEVPSMQVTAAQANALLVAVSTAQTALTNATRAQGTLGQTWTEAFNALSDKMWSLIKILQATLNDDDTRWLAFGLPMPATPSTPGQPQNVTAHLDGTGAIVVQCDPTPLATRYRCRMLIVGVETDYRLAVSAASPIMAISGVQPGQTVQLIIQVVNGSLQGVASEPILFPVPLPAAKVSAAVVEPAPPVPYAKGNGNGQHRNGHAKEHGARARVVAV